MKILPILFGLLLSGFIYSSSDQVRNLDVLTEYKFVTGFSHYYFRVKVSSLDNMYLELTALDYGTNTDGDFKFDICGFYDYPSDEQVMTGHAYCANYNAPTLTKKNNYMYYRYTFSTLQDISYLALSLTMLRPDIYPYTLYIYSESGMGAAIIVLIICLPCIIVAAVVFAVCRFCCGGCRIRINAGGSGGNYI